MSTHYYPLINKILTQLNLRDKALKSFSVFGDRAFIRPYITVAREPGSGGAPIARAVAAHLGFKFIDEQIIEEIAKSTHRRKAVIQSVDEKRRTAIEDMVQSLLNTEYVDDLKYVAELVKVILTYASEGHCVILGRGGNFLTPFAKGLHVLVTAPYDVRVKRAMDFEGHSEQKAKRVLAEVEKERLGFIKQYLSRDADKKNAYDMVLNTTYFQVNEARDVILEAFYRKFSRSVRYGAILK